MLLLAEDERETSACQDLFGELMTSCRTRIRNSINARWMIGNGRTDVSISSKNLMSVAHSFSGSPFSALDSKRKENDD